MTTSQIRFDDGAAYDRYMGIWSQEAGAAFLDWLALPPKLRWLDVGCGSGAFTEMVVERCEPAAVWGIDPSEAQMTFARMRLASRGVRFQQGTAMALPFPDDTFDVAAMPLVIFFVPEPDVGVEEMARVVRSGGTVAAYAWDLEGRGFPYATVQSELRALGVDVPSAPSADASRRERMEELWNGAGLEAVETREITVQRTFASFDDYWATVLDGPSVRHQIGRLTAEQGAQLRERVRERLAGDADGRITVSARANAVTGRVPAVYYAHGHS